ncbi:MAG TPA: hypothetical protein PKZ69_03095 [Candidatus Cloacimonadota bacterium]|nr:hypothetical protein [Candidatus Cloacimonadota bacterium]HPK40584.1 hypothetical protein [Candidatus Cloacimonadota bacterium]
MKKTILIISVLLVLHTLFAIEYFELNFKEANEASGLIASRFNKNILYTHNDSGGKPIIYLLDYNGKKKGEWLLKGVKNRDWEEIAISTENGKNFIFVGDIGDNRAQHEYCTIYKFAELRYDEKKPNQTIDSINTINYKYEDGARDAEAFFVDPITQDIIIITKREPQVGIYKISHPYSFAKINTAKKICSLPGNYVVAADISKDGSKILVKNYTNIWLYERSSNEELSITFKKKPIVLDYRFEMQGEAVCWDYANQGYFTLSESVDSNNPQILFHYSCPNNSSKGK